MCTNDKWRRQPRRLPLSGLVPKPNQLQAWTVARDSVAQSIAFQNTFGCPQGLIPLPQLTPGFCTCQVNVIDDAAGQFRFAQLAMLVRQ